MIIWRMKHAILYTDELHTYISYMTSKVKIVKSLIYTCASDCSITYTVNNGIMWFEYV